VSERLVANMVEKIIDVTADSISEEQLKDLVSKQYKIIRYKAIENDKAIQKRFKDYINEYMAKISKAKL
jgi:competence protein ComGF